MTGIRIERLTKRFGAVAALQDLTVEFPADTVTCLLGPSGCGKTTLLRLIAGLEQPTAGAIRLGGRNVAGLPPRARNLAMVFQYPVTYPTLTVEENIRQPLLNDRALGGAERERRVAEALDLLALRSLAHLRARELDAGGRQRVAVARAVARHTPVLLFDEPTTNIELGAKLQLLRAFKEVTRRLRQTIVYVTHDQTEAMTLADRIALMRDGAILQYDTPRALYENPATEFGGWFLGNPGMSFLRGAPDAGGLRFALLPAPVPAPASTPASSGEVLLGIRPEHVTISSAHLSDGVPAVVEGRSVGIGGWLLLTLRLAGGQSVRAKAPPGSPWRPGDAVHAACAPGRAVLFQNGVRLGAVAAPRPAPAEA